MLKTMVISNDDKSRYWEGLLSRKTSLLFTVLIYTSGYPPELRRIPEYTKDKQLTETKSKSLIIKLFTK